MGPILCSSPHLRLTSLIILRCEAEVIVQTFLIVVEVGRENELRFSSQRKVRKNDKSLQTLMCSGSVVRIYVKRGVTVVNNAGE